MQTISPESYLDERLRLSSYIKGDFVEGKGAVWMRIDGEDRKQLGFDNMYNRAVIGTNDWQRYNIVLDIPSNSFSINYGIMLSGKGKVWFDNLKLKVVGKTVEVTNLTKEKQLPSKLINIRYRAAECFIEMSSYYKEA